MPTAADAITIIEKFGFPVLVAIGLAWALVFQYKDNKAERKEDREAHLAALEKQSASHEKTMERVSDSLGQAIGKLESTIDRMGDKLSANTSSVESLRMIAGGRP